MVNRYESLANKLVNAKIANQNLTAQLAASEKRVKVLEEALGPLIDTLKDAAMSDGIKKAIESADRTNRELDEKSEAPPLDNIPLMTALDEKTEGSE